MIRSFLVLTSIAAALSIGTPAWSASAPVTPAPAASATPGPSPEPYERFAAVDVMLAPRVSNEFAPQRTGRPTQDLRAVVEYRFLGRNFAAFEFRRFDYPHPANRANLANGTPCTAALPSGGDPGCVRTIGGQGSAYVGATRLSETQFELRTSLIGTGHAYLATSTLWRRNRYGYPKQMASLGVGAELIPQLERRATFSAAYYYYPELSGTYARAGAPALALRYKLQTFALGAQLQLPASPLFVELGLYADHALGKQNAPADTTHAAALLGFGLHV